MSNRACHRAVHHLTRGAGVAAAVLVAVALLGGAGAAQAQTKIAVVDLDYVVSQSPTGKALQAKLEKFQQEVRTQVDAKREAALEIRKRVSEGGNSLSEDKLAELQQQYEDATIDIRRYQDDKQREGQKLQADGLREVEAQLEPVFKKIRDEGGYDLILNNVPGVVVMASDAINITQQVVQQLAASGTGTQP